MITGYHTTTNKYFPLPPLLHSLEELRIDRNALTELPNALQFLSNLQSLQASQNRIDHLPAFLLAPFAATPAKNMKTMGLVDAYSQKVNNMIHHQQQHKDGQETKPPLNRINLRSNQLKGNIILGNYGVSLTKSPFFVSETHLGSHFRTSPSWTSATIKLNR